MRHGIVRALIATVAATILLASHTRFASAQDKPADKATLEIALAEGKLSLTAPESWVRKQPKTRIVEHEFSIPAVAGDMNEGRFTVMGAGGGVDANIQRWIGQFSQPDGSATKDKSKVEKLQINGVEVHYVDISGNFKDQAGPFAPAVTRENYRMLGAIIVTEKSGMHFLKFYGPKATVTAQEDAFKKMLNNLKMK